MLRERQHSRKEPPSLGTMVKPMDVRVPVLVELIDTLDLDAFFHDPACRRRLNEVLDTFSDEEFDRFERLYMNRFPPN